MTLAFWAKLKIVALVYDVVGGKVKTLVRLIVVKFLKYLSSDDVIMTLFLIFAAILERERILWQRKI